MEFLKNFLKKEKYKFFMILTIALPTVTDLFVQTILATIDLSMVGKLGPTALAAVGLGTAPILAVMPLFFAISIGTNAVISRAYGSKNYDEAKNGMSQSLLLGVPVAFVITTIFLLFGREILMLIAKNQPVDEALGYLNTISIGIPFMCFNIIFAYGFRAINKSKIPMFNNILTIFSNIIFNYIFIFVLNLGVVGAGIATTISRGIVTLIFGILIIYKKNYCISLSRKDLKIDKIICNRLLKVGIPTAGEQGIFRFGLLIFESLVINLGALPYAAHKIALTAESYSFNLGLGFSIAGTALVGQCIGAKKLSKAKRVTYVNVFLAILVMTLFGFIFMFLPQQIISFFAEDKQVIPMATSALRIISIAQPFLAASMVLSGALRGAGDTKSVLLITAIGVFFIRLPLTFLFLYILDLGLSGAWIAMGIDLVFRCVFGFYLFQQEKWKTIRI